ncbi:MAG: hypothetical protein ACXWT3_12110 [Methylococcaceae bacterium]
MNGMTSKSIFSLKFFVAVNFYVSVIVLVLGSLSTLSESYSIFEFNEDLYGALDNNLRMIMIYLAATEAVIMAYCWLSKKFQTMIPVGFFLILMIGSIEFYGEINTIAVDSNFPLFFLYTGLSHLAFGFMSTFASASQSKENSGKLSK